ADGTIWIAGIFGRVDGVARSRVARLLGNGELDGAFDPGSGPNDGVTALAERGDGGLVLGGMFTEVMGIPRGGVAVLIPELGPTVRFDAVWAEAEGLGWHGTGWSRQRYAVESRGPWGGWRTVGEVSAADGRLRGRVPADSGSAGIYRLRRIWE
ncbi:MAG: delta-60 repeat domain-containing protein, partial [Verrucomicrobiales bacterium]|nr:delta-60 repeat domain-containing protein [Verrucomicrobiales bacterium]